MWPFKNKVAVIDRNEYKPTPAQIKNRAHRRDFAAAQQSNKFAGWTTQTTAIDYYIKSQLTALRARSREQALNNPLLKRAVNLYAKNVVGPRGVVVVPKVKGRGELDRAANEALKTAFADWCFDSCDYNCNLSFIELQNLWIKTAARDGEFIVRLHTTGRYGLQLQTLDPELIDISRNQREKNGNVTRLGLEYVGEQVAAYWLKSIDDYSGYSRVKMRRIPAAEVIHGFICEFPNQSRGLPWSIASLERLKHLDAFDDAALVASRAGASKMGFFSGGDDDDDELDDGLPIMDFDPGTFTKLADGEEFTPFDPTYPSDSYTPFTKKVQRDVGAGLDISYASLSGDMSDVNYSSIRYGGQDEREGFIALQNWLIRIAIKPIYELFVKNAVLRGEVMIGDQALSRPVRDYYPAFYQGRRWQSTDPQKEARGFAIDLENGLTSPQRIISARGDDPDEIAAELAEWEKLTGVTYGKQTPKN